MNIRERGDGEKHRPNRKRLDQVRPDSMCSSMIAKIPCADQSGGREWGRQSKGNANSWGDFVHVKTRNPAMGGGGGGGTECFV